MMPAGVRKWVFKNAFGWGCGVRLMCTKTVGYGRFCVIFLEVANFYIKISPQILKFHHKYRIFANISGFVNQKINIMKMKVDICSANGKIEGVFMYSQR